MKIAKPPLLNFMHREYTIITLVVPLVDEFSQQILIMTVGGVSLTVT